jgi:hypothetical protein
MTKWKQQLWQLHCLTQTKQTPWPESVSELYQPSDRCLSEKLVPTFAGRGVSRGQCGISKTDQFWELCCIISVNVKWFTYICLSIAPESKAPRCLPQVDAWGHHLSEAWLGQPWLQQLFALVQCMAICCVSPGKNKRISKSLHCPQLDHHDADGLAGHKTWWTTQKTMRRYKCAIQESVHSSWYFNIFKFLTFYIWDRFCTPLVTWNFADFTILIFIFNLITCIRTTSRSTDDNK